MLQLGHKRFILSIVHVRFCIITTLSLNINENHQFDFCFDSLYILVSSSEDIAMLELSLLECLTSPSDPQQQGTNG